MHTLLFNQEQINLIINRLSRQILESNPTENIILIGVQPRGVSPCRKNSSAIRSTY
jgi:pyrimidine operon attenuation protein/uracil phosphoribosyltransferase